LNSNIDNDEGDISMFYIYHMVPPGKWQYFYSFGGKDGLPEAASDSPLMKFPQPKHIKNI
jgi:hypothetical protein